MKIPFFSKTGPNLQKKSTPTQITFDELIKRSSSSGVTEASIYSSPSAYLSAYSTANYVGNIISVIANDAARLDLDFYVGKKEQENEELDNFTISTLSVSDFIQTALQHLLLDGNVFVMKAQANMADVVSGRFSYTLLNPSDVSIYLSSGQECRADTDISGSSISHYQVRLSGGLIVNVSPDNMLHKKMLGPHNIYRGMGKIQQNAKLFDQDRFASIYNSQFFNQGAKIPYAVLPDEELSPTQFKTLTDLLHRSLDGASNWMKTFIMPIKGQIKEMAISHTDMQYLEQKQFTKKDIREIFQVPIVLLGGDDARFDSAEEQIKGYYEFTLPRYCRPIEELLTDIYAEAFQNKRLYCRFEYPRIYSAQFSMQAFDRGALTPNELRKVLRFSESEEDTHDHMDEHFALASYISLDEVAPPMPTTQQPPLPPAEKPETEAPETPEESNQEGKAFFFEEKMNRPAQMRIHRRATRSKKRISATLFKTIRKFYESLEKRCLENIKSPSFIENKVPNDLFDFEDEVFAAKNAAKSAYTAAIAIGIADTNEILGTEIDSSTRNPRVRLVVEKLVKNYVDRTVNTRRDELRGIISNWRDDGAPISELKGRIQDYFQTLTGKEGWRAMRIARTEASLAWDDSAMMGYDELGATMFDVVGCEDAETDCNRTGISRDEVDGLEFHPNHTGTIVAAI